MQMLWTPLLPACSGFPEREAGGEEGERFHPWWGYTGIPGLQVIINMHPGRTGVQPWLAQPTPRPDRAVVREKLGPYFLRRSGLPPGTVGEKGGLWKEQGTQAPRVPTVPPLGLGFSLCLRLSFFIDYTGMLSTPK